MWRRALAIAGLVGGLTMYAGAQQSGISDMRGMNPPAQSSQQSAGQKAAGKQSSDQQSGMPPGMTMAPMPMGGNASAGMMLRQSSGTDVQPRLWVMPQAMQAAGGWQLMWMGQAFVVDVQQTGPPEGRSTPGATGLDKLYSTNWGMLAAVHALGEGAARDVEPGTGDDQ